VVPEGGETGGYEEFVVIDWIEIKKDRYIYIVEAKGIHWVMQWVSVYWR